MEQQTFNFNENENKGPVTVLGKTFANDDERREYFREELRKKLPELKKIEGYPIGEDDDIIELSDPPYYTACPNPWLNDFIAEWEEEKKILEKEGKRKKNFEVKEPYASDVSEGKNNPIYNAHSYHTKVPHPAIMRYILHYTQPGDIVLDGFAGTGMTGVAAQMCGNPEKDLKVKIEYEFEKYNYKKPVWGERHAILGDLSPVASFIAYNYNSPNCSKDNKCFQKIVEETKKEFGWLYNTTHVDGTIGKIDYVVWSDVFICPNCGEEIVYCNVALDYQNAKILKIFNCPHCDSLVEKEKLERVFVTKYDTAINNSIKIAKTVPVLIRYTAKDKKRYEKAPDKKDFELLEEIETTDFTHWIPIDELPTGFNTEQPKRSHKYERVYQFYTKRNLLVLSAIWSKLTNKNKWFLTNSLARNASRLNRYIINAHNPNGRINGPLTGTLYIPSEVVEQNIFNIIESKKEKLPLDIYMSVSNSSATDIQIKDNSIDYIFTDPPFGKNFMYSELNYLQESWLKIKTNNKDEAIKNEVQNKNLQDYTALMQKAFEEYYRILKPGKWLTVEFSNTESSIWNSIRISLQRAGFVLANVATLDKKHGGIKAMAYETTVKEDLIISCYKPSYRFTQNFIKQDSHTNTWAFIDEFLNHLSLQTKSKTNSTAVIERNPKVLYDRLIKYFLMHGLPVPIDAADFQEGLKARYTIEDGMVFNNSQLAEYQKLKKENALPHQLKLFVDIIENESDAIQWLREKLDEKPMKYQDIQPDYRKAYAINRKGEVEVELKNILEENFIENDDHTWRTPNLEEQKDREALRKKSLLRVWNEYVESIEKNGKKIKDVRLEALRIGFKDCIDKKDYKKLVMVANKIPENILTEDEMLLNYYDIAEGKL